MLHHCHLANYVTFHRFSPSSEFSHIALAFSDVGISIYATAQIIWKELHLPCLIGKAVVSVL